MVYLVWLVLGGLIAGAVGAFFVARINSEPGGGERRNMVFIAGMIMLGGVVFSTIIGWVGHLLFGETGALILGLSGGVIAVAIIYYLSVRSVRGRANRDRGLAPTRPPEGEAATKTPTPQ